MSELRSICVFAGSSPGDSEIYRHAAARLGAVIAERGATLVYGAGNVGLMGIVADAALEGGGRVIGVIPEFLVDMEVAHMGLTELRVVTSMHERKSMMSDLSDAIVALPGGLGTLEELFEMLTWLQLGMHRKPCGVVNAGGFYDALLGFLARLVDDGFIRREHFEMVLADEDPAALLDAMAVQQPPDLAKWLDQVRSS